MASTRTLQNVVNWASTFVGLRPLAGQADVPGEPALTMANSVLGFILGPPFAWRWNRNKVTFTTMLGTQTYQEAVTDLGWVEEATISDGVTVWPLEVRLHLEDSTDQNRPEYIASELDDDAGNITFNMYPVPDKVYTITVTYQKKPVLFTSLNGKWAPIPDEYQHLYNSGFLAWAFENVDDQRLGFEYQKFIRLVIATSEGLTDSEKAIFLEEKLLELRQQQNAASGSAEGSNARGMR